MKTMRIGSSIVHLSQMVDLNCEQCADGTIITIEYLTSEKEYLIPDFFNPEMVACAIHKGIRESENFDLIEKLLALDRIYDGIRGVKPDDSNETGCNP